jgi:hypothetical protein
MPCITVAFLSGQGQFGWVTRRKSHRIVARVETARFATEINGAHASRKNWVRDAARNDVLLGFEK